MTADAAPIRRVAGWSFAAALCVAAAAAIKELLGGTLYEDDWRAFATSVWFAIMSATGSAGVALLKRASRWLRVLGTATVALSITSFVIVVLVLWTDAADWGDQTLARAFGCSAVLALSGSHACLVLGARRRTDSVRVYLLMALSLILSLVDAGAAILPILEIIESVDENWARHLAAGLVLLVLTSVLQPVVRWTEAEPS